MTDLETCPGCGNLLPAVKDGAVHRYMTASTGCWAMFNALENPERPLAPAVFNLLAVDAYAAQHPGQPSDQTINSIGIHTMVLYGVLEHGLDPGRAMWARQRPNRSGRISKHERFFWLTPPSFAGCLTIADVVAGSTPLERASILERWVKDVWRAWKAAHEDQVRVWFERFVLAEQL